MRIVLKPSRQTETVKRRGGQPLKDASQTGSTTSRNSPFWFRDEISAVKRSVAGGIVVDTAPS